MHSASVFRDIMGIGLYLYNFCTYPKLDKILIMDNYLMV